MMNLNSSDLMWLLDRTTEAVRNIDTKNSIVTAILAGLAAVLFSNESFTGAVHTAFSEDYCLSLFFIILASLAAMTVLASLFASIIPRAKCKDNSKIYAGNISEFDSLELYKKEILSSSYVFESDLASQIFANSRIYKTKATWNRVATIALLFVIIFIILFTILFEIGV